MSFTFELSSIESVVDFNDLASEFVKGVRSIFLYDLVFHVFTQGVI